MIHAKQLFVFGFGAYGEEIAKSLRSIYNEIIIIDQYDRHIKRAKNEGFRNTLEIDIHDDISFSKIDIQEEAVIFCAFDDESFNTFLTLTLRSLHPKVKIVSIGQTKESMYKLKIAGASQVVIIEETGANIIYNMLLQKTVSKFLEHILYLEHDLYIGELIIPNNSSLIGKRLQDLNTQEWDDIIVVGLVDLELGTDFIFAHSGFNHKIDEHDILVLISKKDSLDKLKEKLHIDEAIIDIN